MIGGSTLKTLTILFLVGFTCSLSLNNWFSIYDTSLYVKDKQTLDVTLLLNGSKSFYTAEVPKKYQSIIQFVGAVNKVLKSLDTDNTVVRLWDTNTKPLIGAGNQIYFISSKNKLVTFRTSYYSSKAIDLQTQFMADKAEECYSVASGIKNSSIVLLCKDKKKSNGKSQFQLSLKNSITLRTVYTTLSLMGDNFEQASAIELYTTGDGYVLIYSPRATVWDIRVYKETGALLTFVGAFDGKDMTIGAEITAFRLEFITNERDPNIVVSKDNALYAFKLSLERSIAAKSLNVPLDNIHLIDDNYSFEPNNLIVNTDVDSSNEFLHVAKLDGKHVIRKVFRLSDSKLKLYSTAVFTVAEANITKILAFKRSAAVPSATYLDKLIVMGITASGQSVTSVVDIRSGLVDSECFPLVVTQVAVYQNLLFPHRFEVLLQKDDQSLQLLETSYPRLEIDPSLLSDEPGLLRLTVLFRSEGLEAKFELPADVSLTPVDKHYLGTVEQLTVFKGEVTYIPISRKQMAGNGISFAIESEGGESQLVSEERIEANLKMPQLALEGEVQDILHVRDDYFLIKALKQFTLIGCTSIGSSIRCSLVFRKQLSEGERVMAAIHKNEIFYVLLASQEQVDRKSVV